MKKEKVLERIHFESFYREFIPSLKVKGKSEVLGLCPFHDDHSPSLSVNIESGLYNCFACGAKGDVFKFYQDYKKVNFPTALKKIAEMQGMVDTPKSQDKGKLVATFEYTDGDGCILYIKERIEPGRDGKSKEFLFKHLENDKWVKGRGCEAALYNLPLVVKSKYAFIVEGEGKADLLINCFGLAATCLDSGANSPFKEDYIKYFEGKEVIILPDNDTPGKAYADKIASALHVKVKSIKIVELPGLQEKEDIINWVNDYRDSKKTEDIKSELLNLVKSITEWRPEAHTEGESEIDFVRLDSVKAVKVSWLWSGYIPFGKLTLIDGDPGLGKSLFSTDLASRLTTGRPMPDGTLSIQGGAVLMSLEDGLADTIVPRLEVAEANKSKMIALQGVKAKDGKYRFPTVEDVIGIAEACKKIEAKLVIIDPLMGYMGRVNSWKDQDVRRALSPLSKMAEDTGVAIVIIRHLNKSNSANSIYRGGGSIGIGGAARSALLIAKDPEDENLRILAGIKNNLAALPPSLSYTIENVGGIPKIAWRGVSNHSADALLAIPASSEERSALDDAKDFLSDALSDGDMEVDKLFKKARKNGISEITLRRAKKVLGVQAQKHGYQGEWVWTLVKGNQKPSKVITQKDEHLWTNLITFDDSTTKNEPAEDDEIDEIVEGVKL